MESKNLLSYILSHFVSDNEPFLFLSLNQILIPYVKKLLPEEAIFLDLNDFEIQKTPLSPFPYLLKQLDTPLEKIESQSYFLQQETIKSYFKDDFCIERNDIIVLEEIEYEKQKLIETFCSLVHNIEKNIVILNAQLLSEESTSILKKLDREKFKGKIILCYNISQVQDRDEEGSFFSEIANSHNFYEIVAPQDEYFDTLTTSKSYDLNNFEEIYKTLHNMRCLFSLDQANYLLEFVQSHINQTNYTKEQFTKLCYEISLVYMLQRNYDDAIKYLNVVVNEQLFDDTYKYSLCFLSMILGQQNQFSKALKFSNDLLKLTADTPESNFFVLANMLDYMNSEKLNGKMQIGKYFAVVDLLKRSNFYNNTVYTILCTPWFYLQTNEFLSTLLEYIEDAKLLAEKIGNHFGLSTACHWKGIILSKLGNKKEAFNWYRRCNAIRNKIGNSVAMIKIRNGLSYEYLLDADYLNAYDIINSFLSRIHEIRNYSEIVITLTNLAKILFFIRKFDNSQLLFNKALKLMNIYGVDEFIFVSKNDITIFKSVIDCINGLYTQAKLGLYTVNNNIDEFITYNTKPLQFFLQAMLAVTEGNLENAIELYNKAISFIKTHCPEQSHLYIFINLEFAIFLHKFKYNKEAQDYWESGLEFIEANQLTYYMNNVLALDIEEFAEFSAPFAPLTVGVEYLEELAVKVQLKNQLAKQKQEMSFISNLAEFQNKYDTKDVYAMVASSELCKQLNADAIFLCQKTNESWRNITFDTKNEMKEIDSKTLEDLYIKFSNADRSYLYNEEENFIYKSIDLHGHSNAIVIYLSKNQTVSQEMIDFVNLSFTMINSQLILLSTLNK